MSGNNELREKINSLAELHGISLFQAAKLCPEFVSIVNSEQKPKQSPTHKAQTGESATGSDNADNETIAALAALTPLDYERQRDEQAAKIGCRVSMLDKLVRAKRANGDGTLQGNAVMFSQIELWPEPVNGAEVLNELRETFIRYVALPDGAADVLALWCAHTHIFRVFLCVAGGGGFYP